jgi:hypothetical protein
MYKVIREYVVEFHRGVDLEKVKADLWAVATQLGLEEADRTSVEDLVDGATRMCDCGELEGELYWFCNVDPNTKAVTHWWGGFNDGSDVDRLYGPVKYLVEETNNETVDL